MICVCLLTRYRFLYLLVMMLSQSSISIKGIRRTIRGDENDDAIYFKISTISSFVSDISAYLAISRLNSFSFNSSKVSNMTNMDNWTGKVYSKPITKDPIKVCDPLIICGSSNRDHTNKLRIISLSSTYFVFYWNCIKIRNIFVSTKARNPVKFC